MNVTTALLNLICHLLKEKDFKTNEFIIECNENHAIVSALNRSHTVLFKIKMYTADGPTDTNVMEVKVADLNNQPVFYRKMKTDFDKNFLKHSIKNFDDILYDKKGYYKCDYKNLLRKLHDDSAIVVESMDNSGLYSTELLEQIFIAEPDELYLKLIGSDGPLSVYYKFACFEVYCNIAPRIMPHDDVRNRISIDPFEKFQKIPLIVEAYQTEVEQDIETLEGTMHANVGDWIIRGVKGELYPCKPDIFEKTYERV